MAMTSSSDPKSGSETPAASSPKRSLWPWAVALILAVVAIYAGFIAASTQELVKDAEKKIETLNKDKVSLQSRVAALKQQLDEEKTASAEKDDEITKARADTDSATSQVTDLKNSVSTLEGKLSTAQSDLEARAADVKRLENETASLAAEKGKLESELNDLKSKISDLQSQIQPADSP